LKWQKIRIDHLKRVHLDLEHRREFQGECDGLIFSISSSHNTSQRISDSIGYQTTPYFKLLAKMQAEDEFKKQKNRPGLHLPQGGKHRQINDK